MTLICGVEDAGRGPVIGPLVMAGVLISEKDEKRLVGIGVKDSKLLTPKKREQLFSQIKKIAKAYKIIIIPAKEVDEALKSPTLNLNWLEAIASAKIINALKPDKVFIDCPSNNVRAYSNYLRKRLKVECKTVTEHKADLHYPVVAAASILAKVTRDREIEKIKRSIGKDFGSGYASDPITRQFLEKNYNKYPKIFRQTWETYKEVVRKKAQKSLGEF